MGSRGGAPYHLAGDRVHQCQRHETFDIHQGRAELGAAISHMFGPNWAADFAAQCTATASAGPADAMGSQAVDQSGKGGRCWACQAQPDKAGYVA